MKTGGGLVGNRFERRVGARLCEHVFDAFDHRDGLVLGAEFTSGRNRSMDQECDRRERRKHANHDGAS
jgi:hypothetical protein